METPPKTTLNLLAHVAGDTKGETRRTTPAAAAAAAAAVALKGRFKDWTRPQLQKTLNTLTGCIGKYSTYSRLKLVERVLALEANSVNLRNGGRKRKQPDVVEITPQLVNLVSPSITPAPSPPGTPVAAVVNRRMLKAPRRLPSVEADGKDQAADQEGGRLCGNAACRAWMSAGEAFCRRCSCCICKSFDENKDPCFWFECSSSTCGLSCHIECALKYNSAGVVKQGSRVQLDGSYVCHGCGWISDVLGSWRKLLLFARNARRTDAFVSRLLMALRLLQGTAKYKELHEIVAEAARKLEQENGPLSLPSTKLARGLVTRLSGAAEVQSLVDSAIERSNSSPFTDLQNNDQKTYITRGGALERVYSIRFGDITHESMVISWTGAEAILGEDVVGHSIWCRPAAALAFPSDPVRVVTSGEESRVTLTGLYPGVDYVVKVVPITRSRLEVGNVEARCGTSRQLPDWGAVYEASRLFDEGAIAEPFRIRDVGKLFNVSSAEVKVETAGFENQNQSAKSFDSAAAITSEAEKVAIDTTQQQQQQQEEDPLTSVTRQGDEPLKDPLSCVQQQIKDPLTCVQQEQQRQQQHIKFPHPSIQQQQQQQQQRELKSTLIKQQRQQHELKNTPVYVQQREPKNTSNTVQQQQQQQHELKSTLTHAQQQQPKSTLTCDQQQQPKSTLTCDQQQQQQPKSTLTYVQEQQPKSTQNLQQQQQQQHDRVVKMKDPTSDHQGLPAGKIRLQACQKDNVQKKRKGKVVKTKRLLDLNETIAETFDCCTINEQDSKPPQTFASTVIDLEDEEDEEEAEEEEEDDEGGDSLDFSVRRIVWLEQQKYLTRRFRLKLLTWLGFQASDEERGVFFVLVRTLKDDPVTLAEQLIDTFQEIAASAPHLLTRVTRHVS